MSAPNTHVYIALARERAENESFRNMLIERDATIHTLAAALRAVRPFLDMVNNKYAGITEYDNAVEAVECVSGES